MPMSLELSDEVATWLQLGATKSGITIQEYALRLLSPPKAPTRTFKDGASVVAYWEAMGVLGSRPDIEDSQVEARRLRELAQKRGG